MAALQQTLGTPLAMAESPFANATARESGMVSAAAAALQQSPTRYTVSALLFSVLVYLYRRSIPVLDAKEPPLMLPRIPFVGHLIGLIKNQAEYYTDLRNTTEAAIATLPMLGGKTYAIWDPALAQSALRQKTLSFEPFLVDFSQTMLGMKEESYEAFREMPELVAEFFDTLHVTVRGEPLRRMNLNALKYISSRLDGAKGEKQMPMPNLYLWLRELMTSATTTALLGRKNPFLHRPELVDDLWTWENAIPTMLITPYHSVTSAAAFRAREKLQKELARYYAARCDEDDTAAAVTRERAAVLRKYGFPDDEIGKFEAGLLQLATSNTIPTTFWMVANILARPDLVARLREELDPLVRRTQDVAAVNVVALDEASPLLASCYRESIRLSNHALCVRRVVEDTTVSDGRGESYVLKKGSDVHIPGGYTHRAEDVWGANAAEYDADRFANRRGKLSAHAQAEKNKRAAYIPFGGGRHLCPGRNFASAEILGITAALVLAFDMSADGRGCPPRLPPMASTTIMGGASKPERQGEGTSLVMQRRPGWEAVTFEFELVGS
ncbi:Cytochrome P450 [Metarhizium album ARSEF 1941]|uniref:Cytochrome P450 n=1 Tax=Metarhizium album (strain ARSEF 1941) TaxID=1081103 RepID=A0A0B2X0V4_METAS|nr:Cytochrome P450 [Metarhizium album ARSEF 1941]KHN98710.1 Cytochrome P450 [Metarhizium album ARSEF 1941]